MATACTSAAALIGGTTKDSLRRLGFGLVFLGLLLAWLTKKQQTSLPAGPGDVDFRSALGSRCVSRWLPRYRRGKPIFLYKMLDLERFKWEGSSLGAGKHTFSLTSHDYGPGPGKGGTGVLSVDGRSGTARKSSTRFRRSWPFMKPSTLGTIPAPEWTIWSTAAVRFTGTISNLTYKLGPEQMTAEDKRAAAETLARAQD